MMPDKNGMRSMFEMEFYTVRLIPLLNYESRKNVSPFESLLLPCDRNNFLNLCTIS